MTNLRITYFVEGQTELIFLRDLLFKVFDYQNIAINCIQLVGEKSKEVPYTIGDSEDPNNFYVQIIDCQGDNKVNSSMKKRSNGLRQAKFDKVMGLRDIYGTNYDNLLPKGTPKEINPSIISSLIDTQRKYLNDGDQMYYAVMEVESWLLCLVDWKSFFSESQSQKIEEIVGVNLSSIDTESHIYHPAALISKLFEQYKEIKYSKRSDQINQLMDSLKKEDYIHLYQENRCSKYNEFIDGLGISELFTA